MNRPILGHGIKPNPKILNSIIKKVSKNNQESKDMNDEFERWESENSSQA